MVQPNISTQSDSGWLDIHALIVVINRRLWPILGSVALVLIVTAVAYMMTPKSYTATGRIGLDRRTGNVVSVGVDPQQSVDSPAVDTEVQVLKAPALAGSVVTDLKLDKAPGFGASKDGIAASTPEVGFSNAVNRVTSKLDVKRDAESYSIAVNYTADDPGTATNIVNSILKNYMKTQLSARAGSSEEEIKQLRDRMGKLRTDVIEAEQQVANYRAATNLVDITKNATAAQQELSVLNSQLAAAKAEEAAAQARAASSMSGVTSNLLGNPVVNSLLTRQAQVKQERNDLAGRYGEKHPALASLDRQLSEIDATLRNETSRVRQSVTSEARIAQQRTASIVGSINRANAELLAGNNSSVRLAELERNAESARQLYQAFLDRYRGVVATQGTERPNSYIIANALYPTSPSSPNLPAYVLAGLVAAAIVAALVALTLEVMERGYRSRAELERGTGLPVLGSVMDVATLKDGSAISSAAPLYMADHLVEQPNSVFAESFRRLRTAVRIGVGDGSPKSLAVTSSIPDEGKTTAAICLARSCALAGLKVVLVDCDIRRRASSRSLADKLQHGLVQVLKGEASVEQALIKDTPSGAMILPQRDAEGADYDIITSRGMEDLVRRLEQEYDVVILDTAPVLSVAESRILCGFVDATLLVVKWRKTPSAATQMALQELGQSGANVAGTLLTKVDVSSRRGVGNEIYYYTAYAAA